MGWGSDDHGASSALAFIVAGIMFLAAVAVLIVTANDRVPPERQPNDRGYQVEAEAVLSLLTESPGVGWNDVAKAWQMKCTVAPPAADVCRHQGYRPSLVAPNGNLDQGRWESMPWNCIDEDPGASMKKQSAQEGGATSTTCADYEHTRILLGLQPAADKRFDFHLALTEVRNADVTPAGIDNAFGPPPPQTSGQVAGGGASAFVRYNAGNQQHTFEVRVHVFRTCDPSDPNPCAP